MLETHTIFDNDEAAPKTQSHRVTDIREGVKDRNRLNIYVDNKYFCSLDISQTVDLHIKIGRGLTAEELDELKRASEFGKLYTHALEYALLRPHSMQELRDYLRKKTLDKKVRTKSRKTGEYITTVKRGYDASLVEPVMARLEERGYIDDEKFARAWVENRNVRKGSSLKKIRLELAQKGVASNIVDKVLDETSRDDRSELKKVIERKAHRYDDTQKLIQYLLRQGFNYSDIVDELSVIDSSSGA